MALLVWLPLNGTLENKGILDITVTASGSATFATGGKISELALQGNGSTYWNINPITLGSEASICCWSKTVTNGKMMWVIEATSSTKLNLYTNTIYSLNTGDGNNNPFVADDGNNVTRFIDDKWHHFVVTFGNNQAKLYIDGEYKGKAVTFINPTTTTSKKIKICGGYNGGHGYDWNGMINDFRIYNHCLSSLEVKEIALGLILHYKMDENINILNNCFSSPTFNTSNSNGGWGHWGGTGHGGHYGLNTDKLYIYNKNNTYSHWISDDATATARYLCHLSPAFDGGYRSLLAIIKEENGLPISETIIKPGWNGRNGGVPSGEWTSIIPLEDNFYLCKCEGISLDGSNNLIGFNVYPGYKVYISEAYCENDTLICSNILPLFLLDKIIDSSGYGHHGTIIGNVLTVIDNKSRYNKCIYISSGNTDYLETINAIGNPEDSLTINLWFKSQSTSGGAGYHSLISPINSEPRKIEFTVLCSNGYFRQGIRVNGTRYVTNYSPNILDNKWHMVTMTYDGVNVKRYIDAVLKGTVAAEGVLEAKNNRFRIGRFGNSEGFYSVESYFSDIRVYATALDDNAIKNLYNIGMKIDNLNNIHTFEYKEQDDADIKLYKTGLLLTDEINEISGNTLFRKTGQIYASEFIER